jgi:predicted TIM-barrel fold metal-dependent hydrolase
MYAGPIVDSHMHLWDLANDYPWLKNRDPNIERLIGNYDQMRHNFLFADYAALTRGSNVVKSVHIQALGFPDNPVGETEWLQGQADRHGYPHGIVAYADLSDPAVEETLRRQCVSRNVRGIRMPLNYDETPWRRMATRAYLRDQQWRRGFALLSRHGLVFDLQIYDHQAPDAVALAQDFPDTTIVIDHLVWPIDPAARFEEWTEHLSTLAKCPNVVLKLSGIGCVLRGCSPELVRQYLRRAVAAFGASRCMFGSNCPPDSLYYGFHALVGTYKQALSDRSSAEQHDLFYGTALRVYRL